jgi:hypothetical protein
MFLPALAVSLLVAALPTAALTAVGGSSAAHSAFVLTILAVVCIAGTQVVFWTFTYPANLQTLNWTVLPANWETLRARWEYSHAAGAAMNRLAHSALVISILGSRRAGLRRKRRDGADPKDRPTKASTA